MKQKDTNKEELKKDERIKEEETADETSAEDSESTKISIEKKDSNSAPEKHADDATENEPGLEKKLEEYENEIASLKDTLLRKAAEFENYKRRNENDQVNLIKFAAEPFILSVLPVYDDLERSLSHIDDDNNIKSVKDGLKLVFDKFSKVLEEHGVKKIESKGKPFDFNYHEALMQREEEGVPPHTVLEEIEAGYMLKDKVLRHSKVIVSQEPASEEKSSGENDNSNSNEENN